jgi:RND family efflux transporter MFP subunit
MQRVRAFSGTVEGIRQATVYARIPEVVSHVRANEGDRIRSGQPLIVFEESGPNSVVRQARAVAEDAKRNFDKYERLFVQGAVSEQERDAMRTASEVAEADYDAARDRATLPAPISGVVTEVYAKVGRQPNVGEALALVAAIDTARVVLDVSVYESREFKRGQAATIRSELDTTVLLDGWVDQISSSANPESRAVRVELLAANPEHRLVPGMFVRAEIELESRSQVVCVPRDALVYRESGLALFVVRDSTVALVPVTVGIESGATVEIATGLEAGERVVVLGQHNLQTGTLINPIADSTSRTRTGVS